MERLGRRRAIAVSAVALGVLVAASITVASTMAVPPAIQKAATRDSSAVKGWAGFSKAVIKVPSGSKSVVVILASAQGRTTVDTAAGVNEAGKYLGWKVQIVDGKGDPGVWNKAIQNAVNARADGIVLSAIPPALVGDALAKAASAKIPVTTILNPKPPASAHIFAWVAADHATDGKIAADWIWANSGGNAHVVLVKTTVFPEVVIRDNAFVAELKKCSSCTVESTTFDFAQMPVQVPQKTISALQQHPDTNYVVGSFDTVATFAGSGVQQAGLTGKVKIVSYEGDPDALSRLRAKGGLQDATVAHPAEWSGWEAVNQLIRSMDGMSASPHVSLPIRVLTRTNVPAATTSKYGYNGDFGYQAKYKALWKK